MATTVEPLGGFSLSFQLWFGRACILVWIGQASTFVVEGAERSGGLMALRAFWESMQGRLRGILDRPSIPFFYQLVRWPQGAMIASVHNVITVLDNSSEWLVDTAVRWSSVLGLDPKQGSRP